MHDRVRETRQVRVHAAQVTHNSQQQAAALARGRRVGPGRAAASSRVAQPLHAKCRGLRLKQAQLCLSFDQAPCVRRVAVQKNRHSKLQAFEHFGVHRGNRGDLFGRQRLSALQLLGGRVDEAVGDNVADMLKVNHGRQDLLQPRAFARVVESLLAADRHQVAADGAAELSNRTFTHGDLDRACAIAAGENLKRVLEHAFEHVGHAQRLASRVSERNRGRVDCRGVQIQRSARVRGLRRIR